ncbi:MAG: hypothetical protein U1C18_02880, partial [Patescibacteria group bacterium]|nr:hypothetical protein [Patescibacteria group bacterium]
FEIGKVFGMHAGERWQAAVGIISAAAADEELYRTLVGIVASYAGARISAEKERGTYHLSANKRPIGSISIHPKGSVPGLRFRSSCAVALLDLEALAKASAKKQFAYAPIPYYPAIERDISLSVPNVVEYRELERVISAIHPLVKKVELFDVYHGLGRDVSLALRLTFNSSDRTLESKEVDEILQQLRASLEKKYNISFR